MSTRAKSARSKATSVPDPAPISAPARPAPRPTGRARAVATVDDERNRLQSQFIDAYDNCEAFKNSVVSARGGGIQSAGIAFDASMNALVEVMTKMERMSAYEWDLPRPNLANWIIDLMNADQSPGNVRARERLYTLGQRMRLLSQPANRQPTIEPSPAAEDPEPEDDDVEEEEVSVAVSKKKFVQNDPPCERCKDKKECVRRNGQPVGSRCVSCASGRRACSFVAERPAKTSPDKSTRSKKSVVDEEPEEIEVDEVTPPKKKGLLGALTKGFKRKQDDRSPEEAAASSSRSKFNILPIRPSYSMSSNEMAPPPPRSLSPSLASLDSQSGRNYEVERYKFLLSASQEDLSLQGQVIDEERRRYQEKERRLTERFNRERDMFKARIAELEQELSQRGSGGGGSRRG